MILYDRESAGQVTATFREINSIDQAVQGVVRQMKAWQEQHGQRKIVEASKVDIDKVVAEMKWDK